MVELRDTTGFVLVGGRSSRMGTDKALLPYNGVPLASHIAAQLAPAVDQVYLVGRDPKRYGHLGYEVIADERPGHGPVAGIVSALRSTKSTWNIVTACDLPGVRTDFLETMLRRIRTASVQCVVPVTPDGKEQVLCAVYRKDAVAVLSAALDRGETALRTIVRNLHTEFWMVESAGWSANMNTPEDWASYSRQEA
jgi:molybdenum cofactor guanylyltransferase